MGHRGHNRGRRRGGCRGIGASTLPIFRRKEGAITFLGSQAKPDTPRDFRPDLTLLLAKACHATEGTSSYHHPLHTSSGPTSISSPNLWRRASSRSPRSAPIPLDTCKCTLGEFDRELG